ncbi:BaiN/RdsA family NAD(P)/FAD-dependent oxidoreductase [Albibacterium bauzanense]|uniref:Flavoprotein n=1 Tax=Albibacterium bauzanense TaxID=653929 RepID=A0A4R1M2Q1_9SPHI|nr:TIGR03862 family flavoprotein [Albibacterium bauzanense]TCK85707.1 hypothetical protein C8N28_1019 [Albibacterium bauzanense]
MKSVHIVGAGPAGLMAAHQFALKGYSVFIYDHKSVPARKFLVAGQGGFNLTHSEELELLLSRYDSPEIQLIVRDFTNQDTIRWLQSIGIETYVGSSGKIFPVKGIKPIEVLQRWLAVLQELNVKFFFNHSLVDFDSEKLVFITGGSNKEVLYKRSVFAFGGKSWSKTGSDGSWVSLFFNKGIQVKPLEPSNSGLEMAEPWQNLAGMALKNVRLFNEYGEKYGEFIIANYGIEGSAVYFMNRFVREKYFPQYLYVDLKPNLDSEKIIELLSSGKISEVLKKKLRLEPVKLAMLKGLNKATYIDPVQLADKIKKFPIQLIGFRPIDEVISTYGGVEWGELDPQLFLKKYPNIQCCGEMLNWDAPTGGYLLQACFSSGYYTAKIS